MSALESVWLSTIWKQYFPTDRMYQTWWIDMLELNSVQYFVSWVNVMIEIIVDF